MALKSRFYCKGKCSKCGDKVSVTCFTGSTFHEVKAELRSNTYICADCIKKAERKPFAVRA